MSSKVMLMGGPGLSARKRKVDSKFNFKRIEMLICGFNLNKSYFSLFHLTLFSLLCCANIIQNTVRNILQMCFNSIFLTEDIDHAGGRGNPMNVFHLDGEVSVVRSDCITNHQCRLAPLGLVQTQTLTQWSQKLLLWLWNLNGIKF